MKFSILCFTFLAVASMSQPWVFSQLAQYFNNEIQQVFRNVSSQCESSMRDCIDVYVKGNVFALVRRYCELFDLQDQTHGTFSNCMLYGGCSVPENNEIEQFVCNTISDKDEKVDAMIDAMEDTSLSCQAQITSCVEISPAAPNLLIDKQFCDLMNLEESGTGTQECLLQSCSESEYTDMKDVACGACLALASSVLLLVSLAMSGLAATI